MDCFGVQSVDTIHRCMEEVLDMVARHEVYSFLDEFFGYYHISITQKD
jgi:hypothetical protein